MNVKNVKGVWGVRCASNGPWPMARWPMAGGAIDMIHKICSVNESYDNSTNLSFDFWFSVFGQDEQDGIRGNAECRRKNAELGGAS